MFQTNVVEEIKAHILHSAVFSSENHAINETWKNMAEPDRSQITI